MCRLSLLAFTISLGSASAFAGTIGFQVTPLGGNVFQYTYSVNGFTFQQNRELDIRFDPTLYTNLGNAVSPTGYLLTLLPPNNPPGAFGDYSAFAQINNPSTAGPFSVQFTFTGSGQPGSQPFLINQYDNKGFFNSTLASGVTVDPPVAAVPEPASFTLAGGALLLGAFLALRRLRS